MADGVITLGDEPLRLEQLDAVLGRPVKVRLAPAALDRVARGRRWVETLIERDEAVYGINTGVGHLKNRRISREQLDQLQENLLVSHAVGVGPPAPPDVVRWLLLLKLHMLLAGHSGVRVEVVERIAGWLNADIQPVVPTRGSLGASGDLAPLAHAFLPLIGRGQMCTAADLNTARPAAEVQAACGFGPLRLKAKEGLALINGTQFMCAYAAQIAVRARRLADLADLIGCATLEVMRGSVRPADVRLHRLRPHPGAATVAANIRRHMADSEILKSHEHCDKVQDPYSLRCMPQVHGAFRDALSHFCRTVEIEINSVTDNPIVFGSGMCVPLIDEHTAPARAGHGGPTPQSGRQPRAAAAHRGTTPHESGQAAARTIEGEHSPSQTAGGGCPPSKTVGGGCPPSQSTEAGAPRGKTYEEHVEAISGGNFHGQPLAAVLDYLAIALTDLAAISERRTYLMLGGEDGLPKMLMTDSGLNTGLMMPQYTAAALVNECRVLASPASTDSVPTSLGQEDHVSMGATAALKCYEILDRVERVLAIELLCAAQGLDFRKPLRPGIGPRRLHEIVREQIDFAEGDREFGQDMEQALRLLREDAALRQIAKG